MSYKLRFTNPAAQDIEEISFWTIDHFGEHAWQRYEALIRLSARDIQDQPQRIGVSPAIDQIFDKFVYPLRFSAKRLPKSMKVAHARHVLVFSVNDEFVDILRVLHDGMDFETQLLD